MNGSRTIAPEENSPWMIDPWKIVPSPRNFPKRIAPTQADIPQRVP